jgi:DNA ligase-1
MNLVSSAKIENMPEYSSGTKSDKRTSAWLKLKKDYVTGIGTCISSVHRRDCRAPQHVVPYLPGDTLDLVPIGAWHGNGRKAQWWSPILLAVWDQKLGRLVAVCKCMSGENL